MHGETIGLAKGSEPRVGPPAALGASEPEPRTECRSVRWRYQECKEAEAFGSGILRESILLEVAKCVSPSGDQRIPNRISDKAPWRKDEYAPRRQFGVLPKIVVNELCDSRDLVSHG